MNAIMLVALLFAIALPLIYHPRINNIIVSVAKSAPEMGVLAGYIFYNPPKKALPYSSFSRSV